MNSNSAFNDIIFESRNVKIVQSAKMYMITR